ncbi:transposase [Sphaerisporangium rhizosphaerae]|uniref:Transposase n=1 Tax=Sphaerisporangium rhizosphaerae TaxID=2269375 RepID=A0ABW2PD70_9ACTN
MHTTARQAISAEIDALFTEGRDLVKVIEDVTRLGARLIIQTAIEAEVGAFPRPHPQSACQRRHQRRGARRTTPAPQRALPDHGQIRPVTIAWPRPHRTTEKFASRLFGVGATRTNALEALAIAAFVRSLSTHGVEGTLADALGLDAALSKSTASTICQAIVAKYDAWCRFEDAPQPAP